MSTKMCYITKCIFCMLRKHLPLIKTDKMASYKYLGKYCVCIELSESCACGALFPLFWVIYIYGAVHASYIACSFSTGNLSRMCKFSHQYVKSCNYTTMSIELDEYIMALQDRISLYFKNYLIITHFKCDFRIGRIFFIYFFVLFFQFGILLSLNLKMNYN